jgi:putative ABC transport system permease protein
MRMETIGQDIRHAFRGFARNRGFAAAAILSLTLGLGCSLAIFTVADNVLLRPLPFPHSSQLMMVYEEKPQKDVTRNVVSPANYFDWKTQNDVFQDMAVFETQHYVLRDGERSEEFMNEIATVNLLPMLGVRPMMGRGFTLQDSRVGSDLAILISYRLWQSWFGGDKNIIGRRVQLSGMPCSIVGVLPPHFYFRDRSIDIWEPLRLDPAQDYRKTAGRYLWCVARLKSGATLERAQAEMSAIAHRLAVAYPVFDTGWTVRVESLKASMVRDAQTPLLVLLGAVGFLLAVACANVANLLLARYTARRREMAVRAALGAGTWRVVRQLLTESILLGTMGGLLGIVVARWCIDGLLMLAPKELTQSIEVSVDLRIYLFAAALSVLTGVVFGLAPALVNSRPELISALQQDSRSSIGGAHRLRGWFVGAEVALSVVLLTGALLLFRTLVGLEGVNPGLNPHNVLTLRIALPTTRYGHDNRTTQFFAQALQRIDRLPGVRSASAISYLPFNGMAAGTAVAIEGRPPAKPGEELSTKVRTIMPGYFRTMGIPLVAGRDFTAADNAVNSPHRFIVSQAFVRKFLANANPLETRIKVDMEDKNPFGQIIGVVGDVKEETLANGPEPTVYYPHGHLAYDQMVFVIRAASHPLALAEPIRRVIRSMDPAQPIAEVHTMGEILADTYSRQSFSLVLLAGFSIASLALAAVGIYGVLAYSVSERTREIGVRMALGAEPRSIISLVLGSGSRLIAGGLAAGVAGAFALSGLLKTMLFGVSPRDPITFIVVPVILAAVGLLAAYLPARRAARLNPMDALRSS